MLLRSVSRLFGQRCYSSSFSLMYGQYGDPNEVVLKAETPLDLSGGSLKDFEVLVKFLASPINPADINTIQGVYAVKPVLPAVGGGEGVAEVLATGSKVSDVKNGDWVIPSQAGFGTWRTHAVGTEKFFTRIEKEGLDVLAVAQLSVNPCTAYRMLNDFVELQPGSTVLQNGANSAVGINVIQLAKNCGYKTVNVIRTRPEAEQTKLIDTLKEYGADYVITEEDLRKQDITSEIFKNVPKPHLALNCVGGKNATDCMRLIDQGGVMVTYGGMSRQPLIVPTGSLIFRDQKFVGFWMTRWKLERASDDPEWVAMMDELCGLLKEGKLRSPKTLTYTLDEYKKALALATGNQFVDGKPILVNNY